MQVKLEKVDPAVERCAHISAIVGRLGRPRRVRSEMPEFDVLRACVCGPGSEGPVSVETTAGEEWVGTAERHKSMPKTTCVKANRSLHARSWAICGAIRLPVRAETPRS